MANNCFQLNVGLSGLPGKDMALWAVEHKADGWGVLSLLIPQFPHCWICPFFVKTGNTVFRYAKWWTAKPGGIYTASFLNGSYAPSQPHDTSINDGSYVDGPLVAPTKVSWYLNPRSPRGMGSTDLYICFKRMGNGALPKIWGLPSTHRKLKDLPVFLQVANTFSLEATGRAELPDVYWIN